MIYNINDIENGRYIVICCVNNIVIIGRLNDDSEYIFKANDALINIIKALSYIDDVYLKFTTNNIVIKTKCRRKDFI